MQSCVSRLRISPYAVEILRFHAARARQEPVRLDSAIRRVVTEPGWHPYLNIRVGQAFGPYGETVIRVLHGSVNTRPAWFTSAKDNPALFTMDHPLGFAVYVEVDPNIERRQADHPFEVAVLAQKTPSQARLNLFDSAFYEERRLRVADPCGEAFVEPQQTSLF